MRLAVLHDPPTPPAGPPVPGAMLGPQGGGRVCPPAAVASLRLTDRIAQEVEGWFQ